MCSTIVRTATFRDSVVCRLVPTLACLTAALAGIGPAAAQEESPQPAAAVRSQPPEYPVVPGFERFHTDAESEAAAGGRLLLGELNCTSCHAVGDERKASVLKKQAPVLDEISKRVRPEYLLKFLADPQHVKPGTTMPDALNGLPPEKRQAGVTELTHYLVGGDAPPQQRVDPAAVRRGETLFHQIGCVACHGSFRDDAPTLTTSVPLGDLAAKYTIPSLAAFLREPHKVRPSGRMPNLNLDEKAASDLAHWFLRDTKVPVRNPNVRYAAYHGSWNTLPDYDKIKPHSTGLAAAFDLSVAGRTSNFGVRFEGFLQIDIPGRFRFFLGSDDASKLWLDGELVIDNDGVHPHTVKEKGLRLTKGLHAFRVDYAQVGGDASLEVEYEGEGIPRQSIGSALRPTEEPLKKPEATEDEPDVFVYDPELAKRGAELFATIGCASCHQMKRGSEPVASRLEAKELAALDPSSGCLAETAPAGVPDFSLSSRQRESLAAAMKAEPPPVNEAAAIVQTMTTFNCYACHERDKVGGVERAREAWFQGTIQEMGDEGRIPPRLDGVGDKLKTAWLKHVMNSGADDRPYMLTRMPKFGMNNVGPIVEAFEKLDRREEVEIPEIDQPVHRVKAIGRMMVGDQGLSCIKCHNFGQHKATGIQSIDLTAMTNRLREDWFQRYMVNPQAYRPGTRMPTAWPGGRSIMPQVLDDNTGKQLAALWTYLSDGSKAAVPLGLSRQAIVLTPEDRPVIYRNFIEGVSPRAIAVGYPERANLAFDAETFSLALIWHGAFIDASRHWNGRGQGFQRPLGDHVMSLVRGAPLARLESAETTWPTDSPADLGYAFRGYRLDDKGRPTFRYRFDELQVDDYTEPVPGEQDTGLSRRLTISVPEKNGAESGEPVDTEGIYFRAASGSRVEELEEGWYLIDGAIRVQLPAPYPSKPVLRKAGNRTELLLPLSFKEGEAQVLLNYVW